MIRARRRACAIVAAALAALIPLTACTPEERQMPSDPPAATGTAGDNLAELQAMLRAAVESVAPGTAVEEQEPVALDCEGAREGERYYTVQLSFEVPGGTGDTALTPLQEFFASNGFALETEPDTANAQVFRGSNGRQGLAVTGSHRNGTVSIEGSSECGTP